MSVNVLVLVIFLVVALPAIGIGYSMRHRPPSDWLDSAGKLADPAGFAGFLGNVMTGIGLVVVATGVALAFAPRERQLAIGIAFVVATNLLALMVFAGRRHYSRERRER